MYPSNANSITGIVLTYLQSRVTLGHAKNGGVGNFPLLAEKDLDNFAVLKHILFRTLTKKERAKLRKAGIIPRRMANVRIAEERHEQHEL